MRVAILGAGFTGLTAALRLLQMGHRITIFEKDNLGGLAGGFKKPGWDFTLEKGYHHWFTNDTFALKLAEELGIKVIIRRPTTAVFVNGQFLPFDSPKALLNFPYLSWPDKIRTGLTLLYLKSAKNHRQFEGKKALEWVKKYMGSSVTSLIWDPLFTGKFGKYKEDIALSWFWARIYKRTSSLAYPEGGFQTVAEKLAQKITSMGGEIHLDSEITDLKTTIKRLQLKVKNSNTDTLVNRIVDLSPNALVFDKIISTLPSPIFTKLTPGLPQTYVKKVNSIPHLHAQNLILILKKPFLKDIYWLNITQKDFPFLVLAEHTNFMDPKHYNNEHILYIGNYLPPEHPYLKMSAKQLLDKFAPYLAKINPNCNLSTVNCYLFTAPFAQPVARMDYLKLIPRMKSPLKNLYAANMDMVYPWDRGTNYAIEMGEKVAKLVNEN